MKIRKNSINILGYVFGKLTVIEICNNRLVKCRCSCGNTKIISKYSLCKKQRPTQSCGCIRKGIYKLQKFTPTDIPQKPNINMINRKFGKLLIISFSHRKNYGSSTKLFWNCICECGNSTVASAELLKNGKKQSCGCLRKEHLLSVRPITQKGKNNSNYNHSLSELDRTIKRYTNENYEWRKNIFERDKFTCQLSGQVGGKLCAHHLDGYNWCEEKRYDLNNGVTLSEEVHKFFHHLYGSKNNTKEQFNEFRELYNLAILDQNET